MKIKLRSILLALLALSAAGSYAQAPNISYSSPQVYTVGTAISPLSPTTSTGVGNAGHYGAPVTVGSGYNSPHGVTVDSIGNVYVADLLNYQVIKVPAGGGAPVVLATGIRATDVAVDAAGNVFVTDVTSDNSVIDKIPAGGGPITTYATGFFAPNSLAIDAAGNLYVADTEHELIKEVPAGGGAPVVLAAGILSSGIAVDAAGNVYAGDYGNNKVIKISPSGSAVTLAAAYGKPWGVAVDAAGNVYVADTDYNGLEEIPANGGAPFTLLPVNGGGHGIGIAIDGEGKIFVGANSTVEQFAPVGGYYINALPVGLAFDQNTGTISGTPATVSTAKDYTITAYNASGSGSAVVNIAVRNPPALSSLTLSSGSLSPAFSPDSVSYIVGEANAVTSITITPTSATAGDVIKVNGITVASGSASPPIPLNVGLNMITATVSAADGSSNAYKITANRTGIPNTGLATLTISSGTLIPAFGTNRVNYSAYVNNEIPSVTLTPTTIDPTSTITINGQPVVSGSASADISLSVGENLVPIVITGQNGLTTYAYTVNITRSRSANAKIAHLSLSSGKLIPRFDPDSLNYTASVNSATESITVTPTLRQDHATVKVNGRIVTSGTPSLDIPLVPGINTITVVTLAQNGVVSYTYTLSVNKINGFLDDPMNAMAVSDDRVAVHQGISPNGDGVDDRLIIDGITNYPDNKLTIMNRSGQLVFEAKGYDNSTRVFDGHSNKTGAKQLPGTYFYSLDYTVKGVAKHKTGFIVLKW